MSKRMREKTILIVEDHPVFRQGLLSIIEGCQTTNYKVVGEALTAEDAFKLAGNYRPDLVLVDISLPGPENGIMLTRRILASYPGTRILIISMHSKIDYVCEAFKAGAAGYLSKDSASEELLGAIQKVLKGEEYLDPNLSPGIINTLKQTPPRVALASDHSYSTLSEREQEVFRLLAMGENIVAVGKQLNLSPKTVDNHKTNIFKKLNFAKYFDLYQYARRIGVIEPEF